MTCGVGIVGGAGGVTLCTGAGARVGWVFGVGAAGGVVGAGLPPDGDGTPEEWRGYVGGRVAEAVLRVLWVLRVRPLLGGPERRARSCATSRRNSASCVAICRPTAAGPGSG